jgi:hypothetical protein
MENHYEYAVGLHVIGPVNKIERFRIGLPGLEQAPDDGPLWHYARVKVRNPGFLCVAASRNYGGTSHAEQMVREFPLLSFVASVNADMDTDRLYSFEGRSGDTTWPEFMIEPTDDEIGRPGTIKEKVMVERQIAESHERLAD